MPHPLRGEAGEWCRQCCVSLCVVKCLQGDKGVVVGVTAPLAPEENRGNLFSLARLSSRTDSVSVVRWCCSFRLSPCCFHLPSLHFHIPTSFPPFHLFSRSFFLVSSPLLASSFLPSLPPSIHCHTGIKERSCSAVYLLPGCRVLLLVNEVIRRHSDLTKGICSACCIFPLCFSV